MKKKSATTYATKEVLSQAELNIFFKKKKKKRTTKPQFSFEGPVSNEALRE